MNNIEKVSVFSLVLILAIFLSGCSNQSTTTTSEQPANLKEIVGEVSFVKLDSDNDIIINKDEITEEVRYYSYLYEGVEIGLLAVRDSSGEVRIVINTCQSCGGSPYAYFVQVGNKIQCQNCGNTFAIDSLGELETAGCNPIGIKNMTDQKDTIKISHEELEQYKDLFENWQGPKA